MNKNKVIDTAHEFFCGGDSFAGKAGLVLAKTFQSVLKLGVIFIFGFVILAVGQMSQFFADVGSVRTAYLSNWAENNSERLEQIDAYERGCHRPQVKSIHECAEVSASKELADVLRSADAAIEAVAPMRWL